MTAGLAPTVTRAGKPPGAVVGSSGDVMRLLKEWNLNGPQVLEELMPLVVDDLRSIARGYFRHENRDNTWGPTALVNELYLLLVDRHSVRWSNPRHFFCVAAELMRRLLVDRARRRRAAKRGGGIVKLPLSEKIPVPCGDDPAVLIALDDALERLETIAPRQRQVVELKCFAGLTIREIGRTLKVRPTTVKKDWRVARAWLVRELRHRQPAAIDDLPLPFVG